jgi:hypothetical protein
MIRSSYLASSIVVLFLALAVAACGGDDAGTAPDANAKAPGEAPDTPEDATTEPQPADAAAHSHAHGPHGGGLVCIGDHIAHMEALHDPNMGTVTVYVLDADNKMIAPDKAPILSLMTDEGSMQLEAESFGGAWLFEDDILLDPLEKGRVRIVLGDKTYTCDMPTHAPHGEEPGHTHGTDRTAEGE